MIKIVYYWFCKLLMLDLIIVKEHQRGLLFRNGKFVNMLLPGLHRFFNPSGQLAYEIADLNTLEFSSKYADTLVKQHPDVIARHFCLIDVSDQQVAIILVNGKMHAVLPPGTRKIFWKELYDLSVEFVNFTEQYDIPAARVIALSMLRSDAVLMQVVPEGYAGLLFKDGKFVKTVPAGVYGYWNAHKNIKMDIIDTRLQQVEIAGQEMLTQDRVSLRVTLICHFVIVDPVKARISVTNFGDMMYKEVQFGIREAVGAKPLDDLLSDKDALNTVVLAYVKDTLRDIGLDVRNIGVKDIILPGDMREIMNKVLEAKKLAEANQIKRREETAATRSLLNTAKLMENNPILMRLKELETLEKLTEHIGTLNVYSGFEGLLQQLSSMKNMAALPEQEKK